MDRREREDVLVAEALRVTVGSVELLGGVDVSVSRGRVVGVLGPNGAGKSTLFRILVGELGPASGRVRLDGHDVTTWPLHRRARAGLGYVPQTPSVLLDLTVHDNIVAFERAARAAQVNVRERADTVDLADRLETRARDLSGGERRRLELLRALVADPAVLVCDEPFAAGDPLHVRRIAELLRAHADRGRAVLIADHRASDTLAICDEAILLAEGKIQLRASPREFVEHPAVRGRYLGH
jgi:lipopolysaccharide export system ATP-binding protein